MRNTFPSCATSINNLTIMATQTKTPTVSIGIPAYNEEKNIGALLSALKEQVCSSFILERIFVLSDGSSDKTAEIVKGFARTDAKVTLVHDARRLGKIARLDDLFKDAQSDLLIILDADIIPAHGLVLSELVNAFRDPRVGLAAGFEIPYRPTTLAEKGFYGWNLVWLDIRKRYNKGISVHNNPGSVFAMSKALYKNTEIPPKSIAEDEFIFFRARQLSLGFAWVPSATINYRLPKALPEYLKQSARYISTKEKMFEHFGKGIETEYRIPAGLKIGSLLRTFGTHPLMTSLGVSLQAIVRVYTLFRKHSLFTNNTWEAARSTK
ncbi:MAG: hypothetical protein JWO00_133 [Candidatus Parcubacteria bacterium]|nr:hypothetical protein [Candidatus Parcubacteria bacterium]